MAADTASQSSSASLQSLISTLTESLSTAQTSIPDTSAILPPTNGISLFDTKNEVFLTYLQNLVFLILLKIRQSSATAAATSSSAQDNLQDDVVKKLTELRIYLERGVRPLEGRLKYQIDKVVRAADDAARAKDAAVVNGKKSKVEKKSSNESGSGDEEDSDEEDDDGEDTATGGVPIDDLSYRPNPAALLRQTSTSTDKRAKQAEKPTTTSSDGIYRPPRITPTALPTTITTGRDERSTRRPHKSHTLDEYVSQELSSAPMAEPSIGSTIVAAGRKTKSAADRERERERRQYEETNFVRLPKESKKDKQKRGAGGRQQGAGYGGEDWRGLGEGADRIDRLTRRSGRASGGGGGSGGVGGALERSRKRGADEFEGGGGGASMGQAFEKRRKRISKR